MSLADDYAEAIMQAMEVVSAKYGAGSLNAAIGALTTVQAGLITNVKDEKLQAALIDAIERTLPTELERLSGSTGRFKVTPIKFAGSA